MKYTLKEHGPKWHNWHCGGYVRKRGRRKERSGSLTCDEIAREEGCPEEIVRDILFRYRRKMWG